MIQSLQTMGIVNITPNSFSDGGMYNSVENCHLRMAKLVSQGVKYLDIGAESTAPFNTAITAQEEWNRYKNIFLPAWENLSSSISLSIDTYRPETFFRVYEGLRERGFKGFIIWNDIGGVLDDNTLHTLDKLSAGYIYTFNRIVARSEVGNHSHYAGKAGNVLDETTAYFEEGIRILKSLLPVKKIFLDPGFGFSKDVQENWHLLKGLPTLFQEFGDHNFLLGVSRKRFLQSLVEKESGEDKKNKSEFFHLLLCVDWMRILPLDRLVVRMHDPTLAAMASRYVGEVTDASI